MHMRREAGASPDPGAVTAGRTRFRVHSRAAPENRQAVRPLEEELQRLFARNLHAIKLDLDPMRALMEVMEHPQQKLLCVHVAGTNGKGSVCAMLSSMLRAQGYRTGLYTSPHLVRFNERIQINGEPITDEDLRLRIDEVEAAAHELPGLGHRDVTFFEFTTALAFQHFAREAVDIVVLETGMGGRLDATNVVVPALSVITSIGLEHIAHLGDTLAKIAGEKAGIIKAGRPVIVGNVPEEAMQVIAARGREQNAPLRIANQQVGVTVKSMKLDGQSISVASEYEDYGTVHMTLSGLHQAHNAAVAVAAAECLAHEIGIPVRADAIKSGLAGACWPARNQLLQANPPVILDGAHNPEAAGALAGWLKKVAAKRPIGLVTSFLSDKDPAAFAQAFHGRIRHAWLVPIASERAMPVTEMKTRLSTVPHLHESANVSSAIANAKRWAAAEDGVVVIAGSLYLAGEVLATHDQLRAS